MAPIPSSSEDYYAKPEDHVVDAGLERDVMTGLAILGAVAAAAAIYYTYRGCVRLFNPKRHEAREAYNERRARIGPFNREWHRRRQDGAGQPTSQNKKAAPRTDEQFQRQVEVRNLRLAENAEDAAEDAGLRGVPVISHPSLPEDVYIPPRANWNQPPPPYREN